MKHKHILLLIFICHVFFSFGQLNEKNYKIYSVKAGKEINLDRLMEEVKECDVLFFGEEHNDSVGHYLESKILEELYKKWGSKTCLSLEMFDRDVQPIMNEYLKGYIREKNFTKDARTWSNYRDYRPLVEFAKNNKLDVICANAPGRYSNLAGRKGQKALQELPDESKKFFAPLPYDTAKGLYYEKLMALSGHEPTKIPDTSQVKKAVMPMGSFNLIMAQSLWDATMAYSIASYLKSNVGKKVFQVNGRFHSDEGFAVVTQLKKYNPHAKILVLSSGSESDYLHIDWSKQKPTGDYLLITDPTVPKTYPE